VQVNESVKTYGKYSPLKSTAIYGGVSIKPQIQTLRRGVEIIVATPGRLLDHLQQKTIDLSQVEILVLDECDRMLDMGFIKPIRQILGNIPFSRQTLMFSATFSQEIQKLAKTILNSPVEIAVAPQNTAAEQVEQIVYRVDQNRKRELLSYTIGFHNWRQVLVFTRTKHRANRLAQQLGEDGLKSAAIHGNKSQAARSRALRDFKEGKVRVLVATDVASRGLDIDHLPYVVNFELPNLPEDYVHRIGRTGRAGKDGRAVSLVCQDEYPYLKDIEKLLSQSLTKEVIAGYEPTESLKKEAEQPKHKRSKPRRRQGAKSRQPSSFNRSKKPAKSRTSHPQRTPTV
jgi:ATP-dependent RNA helicase RhlE